MLLSLFHLTETRVPADDQADRVQRTALEATIKSLAALRSSGLLGGAACTCYPQFGEFLRLKRKYDPTELFQSDWYRHYRF